VCVVKCGYLSRYVGSGDKMTKRERILSPCHHLIEAIIFRAHIARTSGRLLLWRRVTCSPFAHSTGAAAARVRSEGTNRWMRQKARKR
jgi:hypothetical protein